MIITDGKFLTETISSLGLEGDDQARTILNAHNLLKKIVEAYDNLVKEDHAAKTNQDALKNHSGPAGLVYGRIQSGKTRAMIVSTAMAFDNNFRVAVVMTSNINDLVSQTHLDFIKEMRGVSVYTKDDELDKQVEDARLDIERPEGRILIIASKGTKSLQNVTAFLKAVGAQSYPIVIFDDEGDQASLDSNTYKRSTTGNLTLEPSPINKLIKKLRREFPTSIYVSVTGTPQAVLLQNISSDNRPSFVHMLPHGDGYIGGDYFFNTPEPEENPYHLISAIPNEDKSRLLNPRQPIPDGLKNSILFFLLSASAAVRNLGLPEKGKEKDKGYQYLCHPSLKNNEQGQAADRISSFLTQVKSVLLGNEDTYGITESIARQYEELKHQLGEGATPQLDDLNKIIQEELLRKKILVINAQNTKRRGIEYEWDSSLILDCHKKDTGKSYRSVYGRMKWNDVAPTLTTQCTGYGNGRFGHPSQNRAISLREAALLQSFPRDYEFINPKTKYYPTIVERHIGNAVPVRLGQIIARSIKRHLLNNLIG